MTVWGWRPVRAATRGAHEPCVISRREQGPAHGCGHGARSGPGGADPPRSHPSVRSQPVTRNLIPSDERGIRWERPPSIQVSHKLQLSNWMRFKFKRAVLVADERIAFVAELV